LQETSEESQSPNWSLLERRITKLFKRIANSNTLLGVFTIIVTLEIKKNILQLLIL